MKITRGIQSSAMKVLVYGPEGIGKSTFLSRFPNPVFIDTEGSTKYLDVARYETPLSWQMLLDEVADAGLNSGAETLCIDTADWAEKLCIQDICKSAKKNGIEDFGYGKGYTYVAESYGKLLNLLTDLNNKGMHIAMAAHALCRKFEQPDEMGAYDRWELKLSRQVAPMVKEWADMVLFANYETYVVTDEQTKKKHAQGGARKLYTCHHACWDAKNRVGLAEKLPFDFGEIAHLFGRSATTTVTLPPPIEPSAPSAPISAPPAAPIPTEAEEPSKPHIPACVPAALRQLMEENNVTLGEILYAVSQRGFYPPDTPFENYDPEFVQGCLIGAWNQVYTIILKNRDETPF